MINNENGEMLPILELIDDVQRLGLGYRFENEIKRALHRILSWQGYDRVNSEKDLHVAALDLGCSGNTGLIFLKVWNFSL